MNNQEKLNRLEEIKKLLSQFTHDQMFKNFSSEEELFSDKEFLNTRERYSSLRKEKRLIEFSLLSDIEKYNERTYLILSQDRKRHLVDIEYALLFIIYTELVEEINSSLQSNLKYTGIIGLISDLKEFLNRLAFVKINKGDLDIYIDYIKENIRDYKGTDLKCLIRILSYLEALDKRAHMLQAELF